MISLPASPEILWFRHVLRELSVGRLIVCAMRMLSSSKPASRLLALPVRHALSRGRSFWQQLSLSATRSYAR